MKNQRLRSLCRCAVCTAIVCILSPVSFPIGSVPITLSVFAVLLAGAIQKPVWAFFTGVCYCLLGAVGLPVFAGFAGGAGVLLGATGGYLVAYPLMALVVSAFTGLSAKGRVFLTAAGCLLALAVCYGVGTAWYCYVTKTDFVKALTLCVTPFVVFDLCKAAGATALSTLIKNRAG